MEEATHREGRVARLKLAAAAVDALEARGGLLGAAAAQFVDVLREADRRAPRHVVRTHVVGHIKLHAARRAATSNGTRRDSTATAATLRSDAAVLHKKTGSAHAC